VVHPSSEATAPPALAPVHDVRVGRQAIYDARYRLVAYQLTVRDGSGRPAEDAEGTSATSRVIAATFATFGLDAVSGGKPVFIAVTRGFLTGRLPIPIGPDNVVIEISDRLVVDRELLLGLARVRQAGYRVAIDGHGDVGRSPLVELADLVKIDVSGVTPAALAGLAAACRRTPVTLVATGVDDADRLQLCTDLGFELFQGDHLCRPAVLERRVLSSSQLVCVRLLNELAGPDAPITRIEQLVSSDPGLAIRLLRSAHSASGAGRPVESLRQALVLIGPRRLRSWLVLTLLEGATTPNAPDELWNVLARAYTCAGLVAGAGQRTADLAYTVGLLAGAAQLLGTDPGLVAEASGVGAEACAALVSGEGPAGRALRAAHGHEREDDDAVTDAGFAPAEVSQIWMRALQQSLELVHQILGR
jgi:c-di-GMP phosphodiesterase